MRGPTNLNTMTDEQKKQSQLAIEKHLAYENAKKEAKKLNNKKIDDDKVAQAFIKAGGKEWSTDAHARVYLDMTDMPKHFNFSSLSKKHFEDLRNAKIYWDVINQHYYFEAIYANELVEKYLTDFISKIV